VGLAGHASRRAHAAGRMGEQGGMTTGDDDLRAMAGHEALAEEAYEAMYDARSPAGCYADLKDHFVAAIGCARRAGRHDDVARLTARLDYCRQVYRKQFSGF
jgi:hypothetical protein